MMTIELSRYSQDNPSLSVVLFKKSISVPSQFIATAPTVVRGARATLSTATGVDTGGAASVGALTGGNWRAPRRGSALTGVLNTSC